MVAPDPHIDTLSGHGMLLRSPGIMSRRYFKRIALFLLLGLGSSLVYFVFSGTRASPTRDDQRDNVQNMKVAQDDKHVVDVNDYQFPEEGDQDGTSENQPVDDLLDRRQLIKGDVNHIHDHGNDQEEDNEHGADQVDDVRTSPPTQESNKPFAPLELKLHSDETSHEGAHLEENLMAPERDSTGGNLGDNVPTPAQSSLRENIRGPQQNNEGNHFGENIDVQERDNDLQRLRGNINKDRILPNDSHDQLIFFEPLSDSEVPVPPGLLGVKAAPAHLQIARDYFRLIEEEKFYRKFPKRNGPAQDKKRIDLSFDDYMKNKQQQQLQEQRVILRNDAWLPPFVKQDNNALVGPGDRGNNFGNNVVGAGGHDQRLLGNNQAFNNGKLQNGGGLLQNQNRLFQPQFDHRGNAENPQNGNQVGVDNKNQAQGPAGLVKNGQGKLGPLDGQDKGRQLIAPDVPQNGNQLWGGDKIQGNANNRLNLQGNDQFMNKNQQDNFQGGKLGFANVLLGQNQAFNGQINNNPIGQGDQHFNNIQPGNMNEQVDGINNKGIIPPIGQNNPRVPFWQRQQEQLIRQQNPQQQQLRQEGNFNNVQQGNLADLNQEAANQRPIFGAANQRPLFGAANQQPPFGAANQQPPFGAANQQPPFGAANNNFDHTPGLSFWERQKLLHLQQQHGQQNNQQLEVDPKPAQENLPVLNNVPGDQINQQQPDVTPRKLGFWERQRLRHEEEQRQQLVRDQGLQENGPNDSLKHDPGSTDLSKTCLDYSYPTQRGVACLHPRGKDSGISDVIYRDGAYEPEMTRQIFEILSNDTSLNFIDAGAGVGVLSVQAALMNRSVLALEPLTANSQRISTNAQRNQVDNRIQWLKLGLDNQSYTAVASAGDDYSQVSLQRMSPEVWANNKGKETNVAQVTTLNKLAPHIPFKDALLKLEVSDNNQLRVLDAAGNFFKTLNIPFLITHWRTKTSEMPEGLWSQLIQYGYVPRLTWNGWDLTGTSLGTDSSFLVWKRIGLKNEQAV